MTKQFYVIRPSGNRRFGDEYAFADILPPQNADEDRAKGVCPRCGDGLGSLTWFPPHRVKLSSERYPDLLWGAGFDLAVSGRFRELYEAAGLQGIVRFDPPMEIIRVRGTPVEGVKPPPPEYHNVLIVHGGADLDDELSNARRDRGLCDYCRQSIRAVDRVILRPGSWAGADIFKAYGLPGHRLVTERFKRLVEENELTNALFIPAEEYRLEPS
jgi:hypothetical protein